MENSIFVSCRTREMARMSAFFEDQADPTLQGLLLIGEAGSGKSALAATVVAEYASSFATVARGAAYPSLQHLPFGLITGLIQSLLGLPAPSVSREDLQKIEITLAPLLGEQWEALRPALHYLLHSPETGVQARLRLLPADQLRHQLFWALRRLVKAIAQKGPLLLFVENLQWADDQSLDFLSSLPSIETGLRIRLELGPDSLCQVKNGPLLRLLFTAPLSEPEKGVGVISRQFYRRSVGSRVALFFVEGGGRVVRSG